jgi:transposase InsO family protein
MREEGLAGRKRRKFRTTTQSDPAHPVAANLLDQEFAVEMPDTVWSGDITYLRTREGWLYLAVLIDLCSRMVVGWSLSRSLAPDLTLTALRRAVRARRPGAGLIHHSDRGSQYTSDDYRKALDQLGMVVSMSRKRQLLRQRPSGELL